MLAMITAKQKAIELWKLQISSMECFPFRLRPVHQARRPAPCRRPARGPQLPALRVDQADELRADNRFAGAAAGERQKRADSDARSKLPFRSDFHPHSLQAQRAAFPRAVPLSRLRLFSANE